eukprot:gene7749-9533_t
MNVKYQWYWLDNNTWVPYAQNQSDMFESEHSKGSKSIKVDKDRFIDLSLKHSDIVSNFTSVTDPDLIGIQRRYDDHMKRRAVKRSKLQSDFFKSKLFIFYSTSEKKKTKEITDAIKLFGGTVTDQFSKKVDYCIVKPKDLKDSFVEFNQVIAKVENLGIIPVESTFIDTCVSSSKVVDHTTFVVKQKLPPVVTQPTPVSTVAAVPTATTSTTTSTTAIIGDSSFLVQGSEWTGVCSGDGDHFPFKMSIDSVVGDQVNGVVSWFTLNDSKTKFKGTIKSDHTFDFQEYEVIQGKDDVEVPNDYTSLVSGETITGKVGDSTFKIKLTKSPPVSIVKPDSTWKGTSTQLENFKLTVSKRSGDQIDGTLLWPDFDNALATFSGQITTDRISVSTYKEGQVFGPEITAPFDIIFNQDGTKASIIISSS